MWIFMFIYIRTWVFFLLPHTKVFVTPEAKDDHHS